MHMEANYPIRFTAIISTNKNWIAFAFSKGTNLTEISTWMLDKYKEKGFIERINYATSGNLFYVVLTKFSFRRAYKIRLLFERDMFDELNAVRDTLQSVRETWNPEIKQAKNIPVIRHPDPMTATHNPQQEAWDRLAFMVRKAKEKTTENSNAVAEPV